MRRKKLCCWRARSLRSNLARCKRSESGLSRDVGMLELSIVVVRCLLVIVRGIVNVAVAVAGFDPSRASLKSSTAQSWQRIPVSFTGSTR